MGERIYAAEDAEALAAAATPWPWTILPLHGVSFDAARGIVSLRVSEEDSDLMIAAHDLARSVAHHARRAAELEAEVARLRAHNTRMARAWEEVADACNAAGPKWWEREDGLLDVACCLPGDDYKDTVSACRALARGEVSDG